MRTSAPRILLLTPVITATCMLAACGSAAAPHSRRAAAAVAASAATAPAFTDAQAAQACDDLKAWLPGAYNQGMPRFNAALTADEQAASGTQLGTDLSTLDLNLQQLNGLAFEPSPPGYTGTPTGLGPLQQDCSAVGVTIPHP